MFSELTETRIHALQHPMTMLFDVNAVEQLGFEATVYGRRVLLVTDANIEKAGLLG